MSKRTSKYGPPHSGMIPKDQYMAMSKAERAAFRASIGFVQAPKGSSRGRRVAGKGDYRRNFVRGKGDFFDDIAGYGTKLLAGGARAIAQRAGKFITGQGAYKKNFVRGRGDYSSGATLAPSSVPLMVSSGRSNQFEYREYLGDVYSSIDFANTVFNINPGLGDPGNPVATMAGLFPWLAGTATRYEQYRVEGAILQFISTSSDAVVSGATTSSLGQVCLATQYNTNSAAFTNLTDALNSQFATTEKPSQNFAHVIECAPREKVQNVQYVRSQPLSAGQDILQYDMGQVNLITQGMPADGEVIGQLWISYKVSLFKPILVGEQSSSIANWAHYTYNNSNSDVSSGAYWGNSSGNMQPKSSTTLSIEFKAGTAQWSFTDPNITGLFQCTLLVTGSSTASVTQPTPSVAAGGSLYAILDNNLRSFQSFAANTTTNTGASFFVKVDNSATFIGNFSGATLPTAITWVDFIVTQINDFATLAKPEKKFGNFFRPTKRQSTAPWMRGKYIHDRTKAPRRFIDYHPADERKQAKEESDSETEEEDDYDQMEKFLALKRVFAKKHKQPRLKTEEPAEGKEEAKQELPPGGSVVVITKSQSAKGTSKK